ncbi:hypothetical protein SALBM311S_01110 [Streptomyces alboniger]
MDAVAKLRAAGADAFGVPLDVTDDESVTAAAQLIEERAGRLDVLVNNAGVAGGWPEVPTTIDLETVRRLVETNVIGVIRVTNAMLPLLRHSAHPRIVNQSSHVGSLALQTTPGVDLGGISGAYTKRAVWGVLTANRPVVSWRGRDGDGRPVAVYRPLAFPRGGGSGSSPTTGNSPQPPARGPRSRREIVSIASSVTTSSCAAGPSPCSRWPTSWSAPPALPGLTTRIVTSQ